MSDIPIRELKSNDILAVERFQDSMCRMIDFVVLKQSNHYGCSGDEMRLFLNEADYQLLCRARTAEKSALSELPTSSRVISCMTGKNIRDVGLPQF